MPSTTFDTILKHLEKEQLNENRTPPLLVHGGDHFPIDLNPRKRFNTQLILLAHEFRTTEKKEAVERIKFSTEKKIGSGLLHYRYEELWELENTIQQFATHFDVILDNKKIIRRLSEKHLDTYFYLFVGIVKHPFYE